MKQLRGKGGFTLLELLVVVIIVGILASIAIPQFTKTIEKSKTSEARSLLGAIRTAEAAYYQENTHYTGDPLELSVDIPLANSVQHYFIYTIVAALGPPSTFTATATRKGPSDTGKDSGYTPAYALTLNQDGTFGSTGTPP